MIIRLLTKIRWLRKILLNLFIRLEVINRMMIDKFLIAEHGGEHPKHKLMKYHEFFKIHMQPNSIVLDIGCGIGVVSQDIAQNVKQVLAIDLNKNNIRIAKSKYSAHNIEYILGDVTKKEFRDALKIKKYVFSHIILSNVLEHIIKRTSFLNSIKCLAPIILLRVPMINRDWLPLYKKGIGMFPYSDKTHFIEYTIESFEHEMALSNLKIRNISVQFGEIWAVVDTQ